MEQVLDKTEKWLLFLDRVIVWSLFAFILLLPIPHVATLSSIAKILPVAAWITKMLIQQKPLFKKNTLSLPILGYLGACLFSLVHSVDIIYSLDEIRSDVISPILLYLVIINTIQQKHLRIIFSGFLSSAMIISSYGIWGFINGTEVFDGRALLTFHYPTIAGMYLSILVILAMGIVYITKSWWGRVGMITCLLVSVVALFLTQARGAIAAALIALVIFALLRDRRLLGGILLVLLLLPLLPQKTVDRAKSIVDINTYTTDTSSMYKRYGVWQTAYLVLKDKWLWGVGYGWQNVYPILTSYKDKYNIKDVDEVIHHAHNIFLQEWLEIGLIGFIMFGWLLINISRKMWPLFGYGLRGLPGGAYTVSTLTAICGLFIIGMLDFFLRYEMVYLFWIIVGLLMVLTESIGHYRRLPQQG